MIKYLALLLLLLINSNLYSSDVQVIELHESITLDQMVLINFLMKQKVRMNK